jgi:dihydrofolate reductase
MYETMLFWETVNAGPEQSAVSRDFAEIWRAAEKVVYSGTLERVSSSRTRIERDFDPDEIGRLKQASGSDLTIGGAELAGQAIVTGLVDELHLLLVPILVGGGKRVLPEDVGGVQLELLGDRRFRAGFVSVNYRISARR